MLLKLAQGTEHWGLRRGRRAVGLGVCTGGTECRTPRGIPATVSIAYQCTQLTPISKKVKLVSVWVESHHPVEFDFRRDGVLQASAMRRRRQTTATRHQWHTYAPGGSVSRRVGGVASVAARAVPQSQGASQGVDACGGRGRARVSRPVVYRTAHLHTAHAFCEPAFVSSAARHCCVRLTPQRGRLVTGRHRHWAVYAHLAACAEAQRAGGAGSRVPAAGQLPQGTSPAVVRAFLGLHSPAARITMHVMLSRALAVSRPTSVAHPRILPPARRHLPTLFPVPTLLPSPADPTQARAGAEHRGAGVKGGGPQLLQARTKVPPASRRQRSIIPALSQPSQSIPFPASQYPLAGSPPTSPRTQWRHACVCWWPLWAR
jgi:hypothetical protein